MTTKCRELPGNLQKMFKSRRNRSSPSVHPEPQKEACQEIRHEESTELPTFIKEDDNIRDIKNNNELKKEIKVEEECNEESKPQSKCNRHEFVSTWMTNCLHNAFENLGSFVANHIWSVIIIWVIIAAACSSGIFFIERHYRLSEQLNSPESRVVQDLHRINEEFRNERRPHSIIIEASNVITAHHIQQIFKLQKRIRSLRTSSNVTWNDICYEIPVAPIVNKYKSKININTENGDRTKRNIDYLNIPKDINNDISTSLSRTSYCEKMDSETACYERGILEVWGNNEDIIMNLTDAQVLQDVNSITTSAVFGYSTDFGEFLGDIIEDEDGNIVEAKLAVIQYVTRVNDEEINSGNVWDDELMEVIVDTKGFEWESLYIEAVINESDKYPGLNIYPRATSSYTVEIKNVLSDLSFYILTAVLVFIYVQLTFANWNFVDARMLLSIAGIVSIVMAISMTLGICSYLGLKYTLSVSLVAPALLGLGLDDIYVIMNNWENSGRSVKGSLQDKIAATMRNAGVSIAVTSMTDFVAFAVGATSSIPDIQSFCSHSALGVGFLFLLQTTFFVACFCLDQRRVDASRNCVFFFVEHKNYKPPRWTRLNVLQFFISKISSLLKISAYRIIVLVLTTSICIFNLWSALHVTNELEHFSLLPKSNYLRVFDNVAKKYDLEDVDKAVVVIHNATLPDDLSNLNELTKNIRKLKSVKNDSLNAWFEVLPFYMAVHPQFFFLDTENFTSGEFSDVLGLFLFSPTGMKYRQYFKFDGLLRCNNKAPDIKGTTFDFELIKSNDYNERINDMLEIYKLVDNSNISGQISVNHKYFVINENNRLIFAELPRNILLASVAVIVITMTLLASVRGSLVVFVSIVFTLVSLTGVMYWWEVSFESNSLTGIMISLGLSVDFSAHVVHYFIISQGTRIERAQKALNHIGRSVFHGGMTLIVAFLSISGTEIEIYSIYYKIFITICVSGIYHGLIFTPVLLSFVGPDAITTKEVVANNAVQC